MKKLFFIFLIIFCCFNIIFIEPSQLIIHILKKRINTESVYVGNNSWYIQVYDPDNPCKSSADIEYSYFFIPKRISWFRLKVIYDSYYISKCGNLIQSKKDKETSLLDFSKEISEGRLEKSFKGIFDMLKALQKLEDKIKKNNRKKDII